MFKAKCVTFKDKDGKPYKFGAKRCPLLISIAAILWILWFLSAIVTFILTLFEKIPISTSGIILLFALILFVFTLLVLIIARRYTLTVKSPKLVYENPDRLTVFNLPSTKVKYEGLTIILSEGEKEVQILYLSEEINNALVKFLSDVGVSDNSQKEEPS